jgi:hypothetical protein
MYRLGTASKKIARPHPTQGRGWLCHEMRERACSAYAQLTHRLNLRPLPLAKRLSIGFARPSRTTCQRSRTIPRQTGAWSAIGWPQKPSQYMRRTRPWSFTSCEMARQPGRSSEKAKPDWHSASTKILQGSSRV